MHALFCLYYVVIYEFKYERKMMKLLRLVLVGCDNRVGKRDSGFRASDSVWKVLAIFYPQVYRSHK